MSLFKDILRNSPNLLSKRNAKIVALSLNQERSWFVSNYQSKVEAGNDTMSLRELVDAVERSEALFKQYPVNLRSVKSITNSVYVEDLWLKKAPTLADFENKYYLVGGRHRSYAVVGGLALACKAAVKDEKQAEELFNAMLRCDINVDVVEVPNLDTVVELIKADNESRVMRGAELAHVKAQTLGVSASATEGIVDLVAGSDKLTPKEQVTLAAQVLTRRSHPKLKRQTLQLIGERLAAALMFGVRQGKGRVTKKSELVRPRKEVEELLNKSYDILCKVVEDMDVVARNVGEVSEKVLDLLEESDTTNTTSKHGT